MIPYVPGSWAGKGVKYGAEAVGALNKGSDIVKVADNVEDVVGAASDGVKVAEDVVGASKKTNPLDGTTFTDKVKRQMEGKDLDHNFPSLIDKQADAAKVKKITGGDGIERTKVELPGSINGKDGNYSWIIEPDNTINHRQFERLRKK
jgi:hypothetical protein